MSGGIPENPVPSPPLGKSLCQGGEFGSEYKSSSERNGLEKRQAVLTVPQFGVLYPRSNTPSAREAIQDEDRDWQQPVLDLVYLQ